MTGGTVKIARALFADEAFKDQPFTEREAFMWMVMEAAFRDRTKRIGAVTVDLKRGQLAASVRFLADAWKWEKSTVDRFLKRLKNRDMIGTDCGTGVNVITIRKYNEYQGGEPDSGTAEKEKRDSDGTAAGQTRSKLEVKEEEKSTSYSCATPAAPQPVRFDEFWDAYPHRGGVKRGKKPSQAKYAAAVRAGVPEQTIIDGANRARGDPNVQRGYARDPATWLNQAGWEDEIAEPTAALLPFPSNRDEAKRHAAEERNRRIILAAAHGTTSG